MLLMMDGEKSAEGGAEAEGDCAIEGPAVEGVEGDVG